MEDSRLYARAQIEKYIDEFYAQHPDGVLEIMGPTASGKTALSIDIAQKYNAEIISVDSRQVYQDIDIASAKITPEEMKGIPHHGLDMLTPEDEYDVVKFQQYAFDTIADIQSRGLKPILCGGTMLWLDAVTENYVFSEDKEIKSHEKAKPKWPVLKVGLWWDRDILYDRMNRRAIQQFDSGLVDEMRHLIQKYPHMTQNVRKTVGVQEVIDYIQGNLTREEALSLNQQRNRKYAKRQLTWWRGRKDVLWMDGTTL